MDHRISDKQLQSLIAKHRLVVPIGASGWKECGNGLLAKKELVAAVHCYSKGVEEGTQDAALLCILLSNRAQAYMGLNEWVLALMDCESALASDGTHLKSYFRKGRILFELERYEEAREAFLLAGPGQEKFVQSCEDRAKEKKEGLYNWIALLEATAKNDEVAHDVANFFHPALQVQDMGSKGRGWVVTSPVSKGTLLVMEKAALVVYPSLGFKTRKSLGDLLVEGLLERLKTNRKLKQSLLDLHVPEGTIKGEEGFKANASDYLRALVVANGFAWTNSSKVEISQRPQDHGFGVWLQSSVLNHSCVPNCVYGFVGNLLAVRASRDLEQGEEVTISYLSAHDSLQERDAKLLRRGFRCECELCIRQRSVQSADYDSARMTVFQNFHEEKPIHKELYWLGMVQEGAKVDDFHLSLIVAHVIGGLSADRANHFDKSLPQWEEAWKLQTAEPLLASMWVEDSNFVF